MISGSSWTKCSSSSSFKEFPKKEKSKSLSQWGQVIGVRSTASGKKCFFQEEHSCHQIIWFANNLQGVSPGVQ